jgi:hypothetical protein
MMGLGSVGYHEHTVAGRGDDPVAGALEYYASRGETPMAWGGAGAVWLGLEGEVVQLPRYRGNWTYADIAIMPRAAVSGGGTPTSGSGGRHNPRA